MSASILKNSLPLAVFVNNKDQATEYWLVKNTNEGLELVVEKMKKGEMPPTITKEELEKLNAI